MMPNATRVPGATRHRANPTHFLCIPLTGQQLVSSLSRFKADVINHMSFDIPPGAVRPPGTMHLTLGVMNLREPGGIQRARELLHSLKLKELLAKARQPPTEPTTAKFGELQLEDDAFLKTSARQTTASGKKGLSVTLKGLQAMKNPSSTTVVYAPPVDNDGVLQRFCEQVKSKFQEAGLIDDELRPLLLHATVINTVYVRAPGRPRGGGRGGWTGPLKIDATFVMNRYEDYVWLEDMPVEKVTLCRMGARKVEGTEDEVYEVEAEVGLEGDAEA